MMDIPQEQRITHLFRVLSRFIHQVTELDFIRKSSDLPLSRRQFDILKILYVSGPFTVSEHGEVRQSESLRRLQQTS